MVAGGVGLCALAGVIGFAVTRYSTYGAMGIGGALGGALILWNPFIGLLVIVGSLPFETAGMLGDPDAAGAISITKLGGLATLASVMLDILLRRRPIEWSRMFRRIPLCLCALAMVMIASTAMHPTEESVKESVRFVTIVVFFFITLHVVNSPRRIHAVVMCWVTVGLLVSAYSLFERRFGATVSSVDWSPTASTVVDVGESEIGVMVRASGSFTHPIWLALYLTTTFPLSLYAIWTSRSAALRLFFMCAAFFQVAAVLATYARMGYLAIVMAAGLFLLRRRGGPAVVVWAAVLGFATVPFWPDTMTNRVASIFDYTRSSSSVTRIGQQLAAWWMFRDNPIAGVGPGNFENTTNLYVDRVPDRWRIEPDIGAHNMYAEVLAELGPAGLILMVAIVFFAWLAAESARKRSTEPPRALLFEALSISALVFAFSAVLIHAQYQKEWWLLLALIAAADAWRGGDDRLRVERV